MEVYDENVQTDVVHGDTSIKKYYVTVDEHSIRWCKDAKCTILHRENGPAVDCTNGHKEW